MIVDDSATVRGQLGAMLESLGFSVAEADDGAAGVRLWRTIPTTVIFLDLEMPRFDGASTLRVLRATGGKMPVILLSGANTRTLAAAIKLGATDYLAKPFTEASLRSVLERTGLLAAATGPAQVTESP
ncbi:MAG: response regulator [Deltaproteobacteria bacterium]|nr:response regulator [Deltaproteobacteria bacterium]